MKSLKPPHIHIYIYDRQFTTRGYEEQFRAEDINKVGIVVMTDQLNISPLPGFELTRHVRNHIMLDPYIKTAPKSTSESTKHNPVIHQELYEHKYKYRHSRAFIYATLNYIPPQLLLNNKEKKLITILSNWRNLRILYNPVNFIP